MAKGQQRGNRETRKPKAAVTKVAAPTGSVFQTFNKEPETRKPGGKKAPK